MAVRQVSYRLQSEGKAQVKRDFADVGEAGSAAADRIARSTEKSVAVTQRQTTAYKKMAEAAREAQQAEERRAAFDRVLLAQGVGSVGGKSARSSAEAFEELMAGGLSRNQRASRLNLARQGADVLTTAAMGMNPAMIAIQQGPQILDAFATSGIKLSGTMVALGGTIIAVAGTVGVLTAAYNSGEAATKKLEVAANGLGAAVQMSAGEIEAAAEQGAKAGEISVKAAREMADSYVSTGRIGGDVLQGLIGETRNYAATTRQDAAAATKELAAAFADPAKGAADLNAKLNFLAPAEQKHIENLALAGDKAGAQRVMLDALKRSLVDATDAATGLGNAWDVIGRKVSNAWDWMGRALYRIAGGGDLLTKIADLRAKQQGSPEGSMMFNYYQRQIDELQKQLDQMTSRQAAAAENQRAAEVQSIIDRNNPQSARLQQLRGDEARLTVELFRNPFAANAGEILATLKKTQDEIKAVQQGYSSAASAASALTSQQRSSEQAARDQARAAEDAARKVQALNDIELQNRMAVARAANDNTTVKLLEREVRLRSLIQAYLQNGVEPAQAIADAQAQIAREAAAEAAARERAAMAKDIDPTFRSAEEVMAPFQNLELVIDDNSEAMARFKQIGEDTFDRFSDLILDGKMGWDDWKDAGLAAIKEIFAEALRMAAINPLKNILFGQDNPTLDQSGFGQILKAGYHAIGSIFGGGGTGAPGWNTTLPPDPGMSLPHNAIGSNFWRGGPTWVGEQGPEVVDLPRGARILDARRSLAAANDVRPIQVTIQTADADSFRQSRGQVAATIARALQMAARVS